MLMPLPKLSLNKQDLPKRKLKKREYKLKLRLRNRKKSRLKRLLKQNRRLPDKRFSRQRGKQKLKDLRNWLKKKIRKGWHN